MDSEIMVEALPLLGVCNLCLNEGAVQSMLIAHKLGSSAEIYTDMLMKCFAIDVSIVYRQGFLLRSRNIYYVPFLLPSDIGR